MATPSEITTEDPLPPSRTSLTLNGRGGGGADIKWNGPMLELPLNILLPIILMDYGTSSALAF